ncbi:MAG: TonB-dependent receptor, partial [Thermodesulfobacteriota bacterium]
MKHSFKLLITILITICCGAHGFAQDSEDNSKELEPVVITEEPIEDSYMVDDASSATKTDTPIKYIPQSVEVIDQDLIRDQGAIRLRDVIYNIPGASPGEVSTLPFLIRGFMAEILRDGFTPSSFLAANRTEEELTNVQRIEVVQGPESILYGNVSAGGIINLITKEALPYTYVSPELNYGSFDFYRAAIDIGGPILPDKSVLGRFNASYLNTNSFRRFIKEQTFFFAPVVSYFITPKVKLTFHGEYHNVDTPVDQGLVAVGSRVANIPISRYLGEPGDSGSLERFTPRITLESELTDNIRMRNSFRYSKTKVRVDGHQAGFLLPDDITLIRTLVDFNQDNDIYTTQNELFVNVDIAGIENKFLFGVEYVRENFEVFSRSFATNPINIFDPVYGGGPVDPPVIIAVNRFAKVDNIGIFAQDQFTLFEDLYILAGIRFDLIHQDIDNEDPVAQTDFQASQTDSKFSPRIGILYQFIEEMSVYGSFLQGFNLSPRTGLSFEGKIFDPQRLTQFEA